MYIYIYIYICDSYIVLLYIYIYIVVMLLVMTYVTLFDVLILLVYLIRSMSTLDMLLDSTLKLSANSYSFNSYVSQSVNG